MKRAILAATALMSSTIMSTPAFADTIPTVTADAADGTTLAAMQTQCDAAAALVGPSTGDNDHYTGEILEGAVTQTAGPTEIGGTRDIDETSITPTGTYVPSRLEIRGNPFRNGGSVNLFGDQWSTAGYYPDSTYNFTADFASTFSHAFSCNINQEVYHAAVFHPAVHHQAEGEYVVNPALIGRPQYDAQLQACNAFNNAHANGAEQGFWGNSPQGNCIFNETRAAYDDPEYTDPAYWDAPVTINNVPGTDVTQDQTDTLIAFEDHGGIVQVTGEFHVGQPVICISPGSKGGSWRAQNGYSGGSMTGPAAGCNTPYFKIAPWGNGSQTSNGTFTSVPNYSL